MTEFFHRLERSQFSAVKCEDLFQQGTKKYSVSCSRKDQLIAECVDSLAVKLLAVSNLQLPSFAHLVNGADAVMTEALAEIQKTLTAFSL